VNLGLGEAGFLSTFITRGIGLPDASIALRRKRLAAAVSGLAASREYRLPCGILCSIQILVLAFYVDVGLVNAIALIRRLEGAVGNVCSARVHDRHPAPNATGIHLDTAFGHQLGELLVGERISEIPAHAQHDHFYEVRAFL
jgi:hypothetical protein